MVRLMTTTVYSWDVGTLPFMSGINLTAKWRDFTLYVMGNFT